jgi:hypothetical protein
MEGIFDSRFSDRPFKDKLTGREDFDDCGCSDKSSCTVKLVVCVKLEIAKMRGIVILSCLLLRRSARFHMNEDGRLFHKTSGISERTEF